MSLVSLKERYAVAVKMEIQGSRRQGAASGTPESEEMALANPGLGLINAYHHEPQQPCQQTGQDRKSFVTSHISLLIHWHDTRGLWSNTLIGISD
ncbi:MAG: hypothetical protein ACLFUU_02905 [Desulfobacteraceae bacterium]